MISHLAASSMHSHHWIFRSWTQVLTKKYEMTQGKQYMKEIKERFGRKRERKINLQQQRPFSKYGGEAKKIIDSNRGKPSV